MLKPDLKLGASRKNGRIVLVASALSQDSKADSKSLASLGFLVRL
jgi:hypothetical protein